ncbi:MAG: type II secretion system protein [Patescibacteria group bacterium]
MKIFKFKKAVPAGRQGFTLIELLVVISVIAVLAVAVLSSINPVEQINKAKDTASKSDASEALNAVERYYATFGCYPWEATVGASPNKKCVSPYTYVVQGTSAIGLLNTTILQELLDKAEIKVQLQTRLALQTDAAKKNQLILTSDTNQLTHICFLASSKTFVATANGVADGTAGTTHVCVP